MFAAHQFSLHVQHFPTRGFGVSELAFSQELEGEQIEFSQLGFLTKLVLPLPSLPFSQEHHGGKPEAD